MDSSTCKLRNLLPGLVPVCSGLNKEDVTHPGTGATKPEKVAVVCGAIPLDNCRCLREGRTLPMKQPRATSGSFDEVWVHYRPRFLETPISVWSACC